MVTVVKRPTGHKIIDQAVSATITDSSGDALVTFPYHGLGTGDHVYIDSDIDEYTGFWYVTAIDTDSFKISEYAGANFVEFYQELDVTYYQTVDHEWSSIFLPIVYKVSNDKWPVNTIDSAVSITSFSNDNGYMQVILSGAITSGTILPLDFVKITHPIKPWLDGVWQVVEVNTSSNLVLDMAYADDADLTGATIQFYYNNYQVKVKVWGGLPFGHPWQAKKPFELLAELSLTPDENGVCMFSISDYLRGKIDIKNNPTGFSMPLNLDAFTGFYICTAETHDISDGGYSLGTYESSFSCDTFQGWAVAGKLPFKNTYSGDYSQYVAVLGAPAQWLTLFDRLIAVEDKYFDISFIKPVRGDLAVEIDKYIADYISSTETIEYDDQGIGVYRIPITADAFYDSFCVRVSTPGAGPSSGPPSTTLADLENWENMGGVFPGTWTEGALPSVSANGSGGPTGYLGGAFAASPGFEYEFSIQFEITGSFTDPTVQAVFALLDSSFNEIDTVTFNYTTHGVKNETFTLSSMGTGAYLALRFTNNTPITTKVFELQSAVYNAPDTPDDSVPAQDLTEEICIDMVESCDVQKGVNNNPDDARLTEDGDYRLLE